MTMPGMDCHRDGVAEKGREAQKNKSSGHHSTDCCKDHPAVDAGTGFYVAPVVAIEIAPFSVSTVRPVALSLPGPGTPGLPPPNTGPRLHLQIAHLLN